MAILSIESLGNGVAPWPTLDPFLFCVHHLDRYPAGNAELGPQPSLAGRDLGQDFAGLDGWRMYHGQRVPGFPRHPHRGFETVTVTRQGYIDHSDSLGATARYGQGDVQWLTTGRGVEHSEMFPLLAPDAPNPAELFQIWLNLPASSKVAAPHFDMLWAEQVPRRTWREAPDGPDSSLAVYSGTLGELTAPAAPPDSWAADPANDLVIASIELAPGASFELPPARAGTNRALYVVAAEALRIDGREVPRRSRVRLDPAHSVTLQNGAGAADVLLLQGRPIGEPVVSYGPFVGTRPEEIQAAFSDYRRGAFGRWPWADDAPVHPRDAGRFARRPDGSVERPGPGGQSQ